MSEEYWLVVSEWEPPPNTVVAGGAYSVYAIVVKAHTWREAIEEGQRKQSQSEDHHKWSAHLLSELNEFQMLGGVGWSA